MEGMFFHCITFNQNIGIWDVNLVTNMNKMFTGSTNFNQSLSNWDLNNVNEKEYMFFKTDKILDYYKNNNFNEKGTPISLPLG